MGVFEEILKGIAPEDQTVISKYPQLQKAVADLEDLNKQQDGLLTQWETWKRANYDETAKMTKGEIQARQEAAAAQERARQLEAAGVTDMSFEEILENLKKQGYATKAEVEAATKGLLEQAIKHDGPAGIPQRGEVQQQLLNQENAYFESLPLVMRHKDEFGEILDVRGLFKYAVENKIPTLPDAYDKMVAGRRGEIKAAAEKKAQEDFQQKLKEAEERGAQKVRQELAVSPTDLGGADVGQTGLGAFIKPQPTVDLPEEIKSAKLGDMTVARAVMAHEMKERTNRVQ